MSASHAATTTPCLALRFQTGSRTSGVDAHRVHTLQGCECREKTHRLKCDPVDVMATVLSRRTHNDPSDGSEPSGAKRSASWMCHPIRLRSAERHPRPRSGRRLYLHLRVRAGDGDRTRMTSLEGRHSRTTVDVSGPSWLVSTGARTTADSTGRRRMCHRCVITVARAFVFVTRCLLEADMRCAHEDIVGVA